MAELNSTYLNLLTFDLIDFLHTTTSTQNRDIFIEIKREKNIKGITDEVFFENDCKLFNKNLIGEEHVIVDPKCLSSKILDSGFVDSSGLKKEPLLKYFTSDVILF
ncbi:hypothetical protein BpHYR1_034797 [Brachionus plicatilis]|uniref:Uncharacterized protein n=1 Tax=Brachionus plicatilis TaxID=10195 RepID=A0A3M7SQ34_BRAPC|nr:hypothetical protein BpHYR1_034797 [Brachionus plicatilis]